jgi:hypothetical protein
MKKLLLGWRALNFREVHITKSEENIFKYQGTFRPQSDKSKS